MPKINRFQRVWYFLEQQRRNVKLRQNPVVKTYLGVVATRMKTHQSSIGSSVNKMMTRRAHRATEDITSLQLVYENYWHNGGTVVAGNGVMNLTVAIEYPEGVFTRVKWSGADTGSINPGVTGTTDALAINIPKGEMFYERVFQYSPNGVIYTGGKIDSIGDRSDFGDITDRSMGGFINYAGENYSAVAIIGQATKPTFLIVGDSRSYGSGDGGGNAYGDQGEIARSLGQQGFGYINYGLPGEQAQRHAVANELRYALKQYCSHIVLQYGINDLTGRSAAQIEADLTTIQTRYGKPTILTTTAPFTTSSDGWATTENQTPFGNEAQRVLLNEWKRTIPAGFLLYWEVADQVESARNSGKWKVNGSPYYTTYDGLHEDDNGYKLIMDSHAIDADDPLIVL